MELHSRKTLSYRRCVRVWVCSGACSGVWVLRTDIISVGLLARLSSTDPHHAAAHQHQNERSVIESLPTLRTAVLLATRGAAAPLLAGAGGAAVTLHVRVGLPQGALEAAAAAAAAAKGSTLEASQGSSGSSSTNNGGGAVDLVSLAWSGGAASGSQGSGAAASRVLLLPDYEAAALLRNGRPRAPRAARTPALTPSARLARPLLPGGASASGGSSSSSGGGGGDGELGALSESPAWPRPQGLARQRAAPVAELQAHLDALAAALAEPDGASGSGSGGTSGSANASAPAAAASGARARELSQLLPSVEAALRRAPARLRSRAYSSWLSQRLAAAPALGWARRDAAAAAAAYARCVGCEGGAPPALARDAAARLGVADAADVRLAPAPSKQQLSKQPAVRAPAPPQQQRRPGLVAGGGSGGGDQEAAP